MSEEQTDGQAIESALPPAAAETSPDNKQDTQTQTKPTGAYQGPVDLSELPEDIRNPIEARFAHMSRLMKKNEIKYESRLSEREQLLAEQSRIIEELQSGVGAVVDHLRDSSLNDAETKIMARMEQAQESGDTKAFLAAQKDLVKLEAKKLSLEEKKSAPKPKAEKQNTQLNSARGLANQGVSDGDLTSEDAVTIEVWQQEKDENGNLLRPWAQSRTPDSPTNDPYYRRALIEAAAVFDEASPWANKSTTEKLAEVDRRMGVSRPVASQAVMGGSLTNARKGAKITLSPNQERIAVRTKFGGPKAKSDADHIAAYRAQVEKYKSTKGAR